MPPRNPAPASVSATATENLLKPKRRYGPKSNLMKKWEAEREQKFDDLPPEQQESLIKDELARRLAKRDLQFLMTDVLGYPATDDIHREIEEFLAQVTAPAGRHRALLLIPRGHLKSTLVTVCWTIQRIIENPNIRILISNGYLENAKGFLREIKSHLEKSERFRHLFGDLVNADDKWTETQIVVRSRTEIRKEPTIQVSSVDKSVVSQHYDLIIGDDLVNRENINTREQRQKIILYYKDLYDLIEPAGTMVFIGTRWHHDDLYGRIIRDNEHDKNFDVFVRTVWADQEKRVPLFPRKFTPEYIDGLRRDKGPYEFSCTPAETPILMEDFTMKPISEVRVGDKVVGFTVGHGQGKHRLVVSEVKRTFSKTALVHDVVLENGDAVKCTADHRWFTNRDDVSHKPYAQAKIGGRLMRISSVRAPLADGSAWDWAWLGGMFDGEGHCRDAALYISQSSSHNPLVCSKIEETLTRCGFSWGRTDSANSYWISGWEERRRFLLNARPYRRDGIIESLYRRGGRFVREEPRIVSIRPELEREVFALETTTGNYVAWGYASSNSQYMNNPTDDENADFKREWIRIEPLFKLEAVPLAVFISIDPAMTKSETADYSGFVVNGVDSQGAWRLLRAYRKRLDPAELIDELFFLNDLYGSRLRRMGIEKTAYTVGLRQSIQNEMIRRKRFFDIVEVEHKQRNKETRIRALVPRFESGRITMSEYCQDLVEEVLSFPRGEHEDTLDALAYQLDLADDAQPFNPGEIGGEKIMVIKPRFQRY